MLSILTLKNSTTAIASYYEADNYYAKDSPEHKELSEWFGKGAQKLRLQGNVGKEDFQNLLEGQLPTGDLLGRKEGAKNIHTPGIDLTFSAPKSVSIMAEVYKDKRIVAAHNEAVKKALQYVEDNLVATRSFHNDKEVYEKVDNIVAALFKHDVSRGLDPQLHTHCILMNATLRDDKQWRSARFGNIFDHKMMLGQLYRMELAHSLKELGYEIKICSNDSRFELATVPEAMIKDFSKRAEQINLALGDKADGASAILKEKVTLATRQNKQDINRHELEKIWQATSNQYELISSQKKENQSGIFKKLITFFTGKEIEYEHFLTNDSKGKVETKAIKYATEHCSERSSFWSDSDMLRNAMGYATALTTFDQLVTEQNTQIKNGDLIKIWNVYDKKTYLSTKEALALEKETIKLMRDGQGKLQPNCTSAEVMQKFSGTSLKQGQREAIALIMTTQDRIVGVQGYAGTGKTHMLTYAKNLLEGKDYKPIGLAPSASAARTLESDTDITSITLQRFLAKYDGVINNRATINGLQSMKKDLAKNIIIVDESSLASTKQINSLLKLSHTLDFKVVLLGDRKQLNAVGAGQPFAQLQRTGMQTAVTSEIVRQTNVKLKQSVYDAINRDVRSAFERLDDNIIANDTKPLAKVAAEKWLSLTPETRDKTLLISPLNDTRARVNQEIRTALIKEDTLHGQAHMQTIFVSRQLTQAEKTNPFSYEMGNAVLFSQSIPAIKVKKHDELTVKLVNKFGVVTLIRQNGSEIKFQPNKLSASRASSIDVCTTHNQEYKIGERLKFTKNSDDLKWFINSETAKIVGIDSSKLYLELKAGAIQSLKKDHPQLRYTDYGYCSTVHSAQGKTTENVIGIIESDHKHLTTLPLFYVSISRAKESAILITDDKRKLADTLAKQTGEAVSIMEGRIALEKRESQSISKPVFVKEAKITTKEIYESLYNNLPSALPEFGFKRMGSNYVSTTDAKIDGSAGKKGKVYVYANNPGKLIDYTRQNTSIWDYVAQRHVNSSSKEEIMKYLIDLSGLGNSIKPQIVTATQKVLETKKPSNLDHKLLNDIKTYSREKLFEKPDNAVLKYLQKDRSYDLKLIEKMELGYIDSHKNLKSYLEKLGYSKEEIENSTKALGYIGKTHKLVIAFENKDGATIGFIGRNIFYKANSELGKYMYSKGLNKSDQLFNISTVTNKEVWVVEGIFDCLHAKAKGLDNIVALGGTSFNERQLKLLQNKGVNQINICLDKDQAGREATYKMADMISKLASNIEIKVVALPSKIKDPDEAMGKISVQEFRGLATAPLIHQQVMNFDNKIMRGVILTEKKIVNDKSL